MRKAPQPVLQILVDACGRGGGLVLMVLIMLCIWHCGLFSLVRGYSYGIIAYETWPNVLLDFELEDDVCLCP